MNTFSDIYTAIQSDLTVGSESSLFDLTTIKNAVNRAYIKVGALHLWAGLRDSLKTSTIANQEYYDYPPAWQSDSVWKLSVDGTDYGDPLAFKDYLFEQENNYPSGLVNLWSNQRDRYFITPTPTSNGDNNITIWGYTTVSALSNDSDTTIFSYGMQEVNEGIALEATAILKNKGEILPPLKRGWISGAALLDALALELINNAWKGELMMNVKYEKTIPQFDVPDLFAPRSKNANALRNKIGNF